MKYMREKRWENPDCPFLVELLDRLTFVVGENEPPSTKEHKDINTYKTYIIITKEIMYPTTP